MKSQDVRQSFIDYFKSKDHRQVSSSSLIPHNDPTLLFNNAGMNQFKNIFAGLEKADHPRAVTAQKCVRAGGKHNDLENVGFTARHHTFFEMMGNFSFGDYFKSEAIHYAWDYLTNTLQIPKDKLYVTVFETDDEAADIWHKQEGIPKDRIYRFGEKDNFWRMGDTGPCGPCSEVFYDLGPEVGGNPKDNVMGGEGDRYMEIWNLVFMQYYEEPGKDRISLPAPSIDTGAGLERLSAVMQGELSNYHTDSFMKLIESAMRTSGKTYHKTLKEFKGAELEAQKDINVAFRVMADHARSAAFLIADGVLPSNEGRGYVLRRIMRRAIRYGRKLGDQSLLPVVVQEVINSMGGHYAELIEQQNRVLELTKDEEDRFLRTLDQGEDILSQALKKLESHQQSTLPGEVVFQLYDTFGFPVDLTQLIAEERGFKVDEVGFEPKMEQAKQKAKASWKGKGVGADEAHLMKVAQGVVDKTGETKFLGYQKLNTSSDVVALSNGKDLVDTLKAGEDGYVVTVETPFYAESGGQVGDSGTLSASGMQADILDCTKKLGVHFHHVKVETGAIKAGPVDLQVTGSLRRRTASNHSATHLLHAALREVLGEHITQAGSLVEPDRLRFDFTHKKPLSVDETQRIESLVNREISKAIDVQTEVMTPDQAKQKGALALFGEKYGDEVRVLTMGEFSMELCGGTHVSNTSAIRLFKIVSEGGVSSGVRRIEALTGDDALGFLNKHFRQSVDVRNQISSNQNWVQFLESDQNVISEWIDKSIQQNKELQKELQKAKGSQIDTDKILSDATPFSYEGTDGRLVLADIPVDDRKVLSETSDHLKDKIGQGIVVVIGQGDKSNPVIVTVSKDLSKKIKAGDLLKEIASIMGGKGGGRPDFAQGAAPDRSKLEDAFKKARELVGG